MSFYEKYIKQYRWGVPQMIKGSVCNCNTARKRNKLTSNDTIGLYPSNFLAFEVLKILVRDKKYIVSECRRGVENI